MIYRTLHWYILRELLRVFLLTACALTVLLAFGGTFRPITKGGLSIGRLLLVIVNLMPAMLAYAIPVAALFAAVLVYWRMSTDNEIIACRAGGMSSWAVLLPSLILGLVVASADLLFVNDVVPLFLQRTEQTIRRDIGALLVHNVERQELFEFGQLVVYADEAKEGKTVEYTDPDGAIRRRTVVTLIGVAATPLRDGKPTAIVVARKAYVYIDEVHGEADAWVKLEDGAAFDPNSLRRVGGAVSYLPPEGTPFVVPSILRDKPKFLNNHDLKELSRDPGKNETVREAVETLQQQRRFQGVGQELFDHWRANTPMEFAMLSGETATVTAPLAELSADRQIQFSGTPGNRVKINYMRNGRTQYVYTCDAVNFLLRDDPGSPNMLGTLRLSGPVQLTNVRLGLGATTSVSDVLVQPIAVAAPAAEELEKVTDSSPVILHQEQMVAHYSDELSRSIHSELHSRGSFALSCLALVLLGAGLGILLHGRNPLAVFVVGFVPAVVLVLLMTAGKRMVEGTDSNPLPGYCVIWAGDGLILFIAAALYVKLARH